MTNVKQTETRTYKDCLMDYRKIPGISTKERADDLITMYDCIDDENIEEQVEFLLDLTTCYPSVVDRIMDTRPDIKVLFCEICSAGLKMQEEERKAGEQIQEMAGRM